MWFWPEELKQNENVFTVKRSWASVHPEYSVSSLKPLLNLTFMCWCIINFSWRPSFFMWCFYVSCFAFMFLALLTWLFNKVSLLFFFVFLLMHLCSCSNPTRILQKNHSLPSQILTFHAFILVLQVLNVFKMHVLLTVIFHRTPNIKMVSNL